MTHTSPDLLFPNRSHCLPTFTGRLTLLSGKGDLLHGGFTAPRSRVLSCGLVLQIVSGETVHDREEGQVSKPLRPLGTG